jgi:hypothetical protein
LFFLQRLPSRNFHSAFSSRAPFDRLKRPDSTGLCGVSNPFAKMVVVVADCSACFRPARVFEKCGKKGIV